MSEKAVNAQQDRRIGWLDIARGIGVLLVLWGHIFRYGGRPSIVIFSFHMPLFYMISGYLFSPEKESDFTSFVRKRARSLLLPYLISCLLGLLVTLSVPSWRAELSLETIFNDVFYLGAPNCLHVGQVWFFLCLFFVEITAFSLYKLLHLRTISLAGKVLTIFLIAGIGVTLPAILPRYFVLGRLPWMLDTSIVALVFYLIGFFAKTSSLLQHVDEEMSRLAKIVLAVTALVLTAFISIKWLGWVNIGALIFSFPPLYFSCAILGSLGVMLLAMGIEKNSALQTMGRESLVLVVIHSFLIYILLAISSHYYGYEIILGENPPKAVALFGCIILAVVLSALGHIFTQARKKFANRTAERSFVIGTGSNSHGNLNCEDMAIQLAASYKSETENHCTISTSKHTRRNSTIELLRILCMLLVIAHHGVVHGGALGMEPCANKVLASFILPGGKIAFTCFVAISTWFLIDQQFKGSRFLRAWLEVLFYSVAMIAVSTVLGAHISARDWIGSVLPIGGNTHGFAAAYLAFYLLIPILSRISLNLTKNQVQWIIILGAYLQVFEKVLATYGMANLALHPFPSEILLFIFCYFISLYIKRWGFKILYSPIAMFAIFIVIWLIVFLLTWMSWSQNNQTVATFLSAFASDENSLLYLVGGFALFLAFQALPPLNSPIINLIASTTFGVLLIHDHGFFRYVLWNNIISAPTWWYSQHYLLHLAFVTVAVFTMCALVDYVRQRLLEPPVVDSRLFRSTAKRLDDIWARTPQPNNSN